MERVAVGGDNGRELCDDQNEEKRKQFNTLVQAWLIDFFFAYIIIWQFWAVLHQLHKWKVATTFQSG